MRQISRSVAGALVSLPLVAGFAIVAPEATANEVSGSEVSGSGSGQLDLARLSSDLGEEARTSRSDSGEFVATRLSDGTPAVAGVALMADGRAFAVSAKAVDIAWEGNPKAASYSIVRDGSTIAELGPLATSYRDAEVSSGNTYQYQVIPHPREDKEAGFLPFWGFEAVMPALGGAGMVAAQDSKELTVGEADSLAESMAKAAATEATAAIGWKTFIAESRIPVPTFGPLKPCTYDNSHDFGGDGRSWDAHSPRYRTSLAAYVKWSDKSVTQGSKIGPTNVYRGSTLVATQTAPKDSMIARKIGSTSSSIDVQFNFSARNPFCGITSKISGAMIIRLTAGGSYLVLQGSHVQMPAHQVYILRGASTADVYRASAVGPICLAGYVFCPERDMTGLSGKY